MAKRTPDDTDGAAAFRKRQKITHDLPTGEHVVSSDHLRKLLAFDQDLLRARHGMVSMLGAQQVSELTRLQVFSHSNSFWTT